MKLHILIINEIKNLLSFYDAIEYSDDFRFDESAVPFCLKRILNCRVHSTDSVLISERRLPAPGLLSMHSTTNLFVF